MFTGIVAEVGTVKSLTSHNGRTFTIRCSRPAETIDLGASIACSGCCLTATRITSDGEGALFDVDVSEETLRRTTLGSWETGTQVNLESSLRIGDELGGHIVSGHVDGLGEVTAVEPEGASHKITVAIPKRLGRFVAEKGSIALDGVSLTVNGVTDEGDRTLFDVNVIPHTWAVTTLGALTPGARLNVEIDLMARYAARLAEAG